LPILLATLAGAFIAALTSWLLARNAAKRQAGRDLDAADAQYRHDLDTAVAEVIATLGRYMAMRETNTIPVPATRGSFRGAVSTSEHAAQELGTALLVAVMTARGRDQQPLKIINEAYVNRPDQDTDWPSTRSALEAFSTSLSAWRSGESSVEDTVTCIKKNAAVIYPNLADCSAATAV